MKIFCKKLHKEGEQLSRKPIAGALGDEIYHNICQEAWQMWVKEQTKWINERRLSLNEEKDRLFLYEKMREFFFTQS